MYRDTIRRMGKAQRAHQRHLYLDCRDVFDKSWNCNRLVPVDGHVATRSFAHPADSHQDLIVGRGYVIDRGRAGTY